MPPSEPPSASKPKRRVARKAKPTSTPRPSAQNAAAYVSQGKAVEKTANAQKRAVRTQRATQHAQPLDARAGRPVAPTQVSERGHVIAKPLAAQPMRNTRAGKPVVDSRVARGVAVAAYDQLSTGAKRGHLAGARKRVQQGKGTEGDTAILHAHDTRVTGKQKVARATKAYDAIAGPSPHDFDELAEVAKTASPKVKALTKRDPVTPLETSGLGNLKLRDPGAAITAVGKASALGWKYAHAPKIVQNAPKDIAEIAVTTPSAVAKLASTAVTHPKKVPGMLAAPYVELAKHPKKFITEHPVSAALMVAPAVKMPGRAAGRVARVAGKQTLTRPSATLPGSVLKEARTGNRGVVTRAVQARKDTKHGAPTMTVADVTRRVDESYDYGKQHSGRVEMSATKSFKNRPSTKAMPKAERKAATAEHVKGARAGAKHQASRAFAEEFGAPHVVERAKAPMPRGPKGETPDQFSARAQAHRASLPSGKIVVPKDATKGALHDSQADAQVIADHLNAQGIKIARGSSNPATKLRRNTQVDLEYKVQDAGHGQFAVVPSAAAEILRKHGKVGSSGAPGSKLMRVAGKSFRTAVIPTSVRWLFGQGGEAGIRSAVAGAGPLDLARESMVVRRMNKNAPGSGDAFRTRLTGGQFGISGTAREFAEGRSLADEFKDTALEDIAHGITKAGATRPAMAARKGFKGYTHVVYNVINDTIEKTARRAMTGQAIRQGPLMEKHLVGLTDKAIADAAKGLKHTENQVAAGRALNRMYGQYQGFSWQTRETLLHTTPFYPWYRNVVTFLTKTLPVDHPVKTALLADLDAATEDWRKAHGLSLRQGGHRPGFMLGGYPAGGDRVTRFGRYTPFAPGDAYGSVADLVTPQFAGTKATMKGVDWKGDEIKGNIPANAAENLAEAHVPFYGMAGRLTGIPGHYIKKTGEPSVLQGKKMRPALRKEFNPVEPTGKKAAKSSGKGTSLKAVKVKPVKVKPVKLKRVRAG